MSSHKKLILVFIMCLALLLSFTGCKNKKDEEKNKEKNLNVYMDIKDRHSVDILKFIVDEYKKENSKVKINFNNTLGSSNLVEDINKGTETDIMFVSRTTMIELAQMGLLSEMGEYYEKNKINENNINVMSNYGRVGEKYFGIAMAPNVIEIVYNKEALKKLNLNIPGNLNDLKPILKKLKESSIRVPVILTEDIDKNAGLASIIFSNKTKAETLDKVYSGGKEELKNLKEMQGIFDSINSLVKDGIVNNNSFEIGNESSINALNKGSMPLVICISYYNSSIKGENVDIIKDYSMNGSEKSHIPVIVNSLLCVPTSGKNGEEASKFIKYALSEELQKKLVEKGFISGNKKANASVTGINKDIVENIFDSGDNSIVFIYNMPKKLTDEVVSKINSILTGKYTGKEWEEVVESGS